MSPAGKPAPVYERLATKLSGLCFCPSCIAASPARAALKLAVARATRKRVALVTLEEGRP